MVEKEGANTEEAKPLGFDSVVACVMYYDLVRSAKVDFRREYAAPPSLRPRDNSDKMKRAWKISCDFLDSRVRLFRPDEYRGVLRQNIRSIKLHLIDIQLIKELVIST